MTAPVTALARPRSALAWLALAAGVLAPLPGAGVVGAAAVFAAIVLGWRDLRRMARVIFVLVVVAAVPALPDGPVVLIDAADAMTRLTALILTVMLLSSVLGRFPDLGRISGSLFAGRPLGRYFSLSLGTAFLSVPLNFGSVGVVGALVGGRISERGDSAVTRNAARATLRGFGASPICSPLSISVVVTLTFLPDLPGWQLIACSLPLALLYLLGGALLRDPEPAAADGEPAPSTGWAPWLRFAAVIAAICAATFGLSGLAGLSYSRAVTLSCLATVVLGLLVERWRGHRPSLPSLAPVTNELVIVGGSAFLGALVSTFAARGLGADFVLPVWGYPLAALLVPWLFFVAGLAGFNPIVTGALVGGVLAPIWPQGATLGLALAMVCGWGVTIAGTPYSANALLLERLTGYPARVGALRWNWPLSAVALLVAGGLGALLTLLLAPAG